MSDRGLSTNAPPGNAATPELLADAWGAVARTALVAEGNSFQAWARLSLVNRAWRDGLRGAHTSTALAMMSCCYNMQLASKISLSSGVAFCFTSARCAVSKTGAVYCLQSSNKRCWV